MVAASLKKQKRTRQNMKKKALFHLETRQALADTHFIFSAFFKQRCEKEREREREIEESHASLQRGYSRSVHAHTRHTHTHTLTPSQINMYDSIAVGFLLCMLMILYKFNNAAVQRVAWRWRRRQRQRAGRRRRSDPQILANPPLPSLLHHLAHLLLQHRKASREEVRGDVM